MKRQAILLSRQETWLAAWGGEGSVLVGSITKVNVGAKKGAGWITQNNFNEFSTVG